MVSRLRSWWEKIVQHRVAIGVVGIVLVAVIALIIAGYWFDWTGFDGYTQVTTAHIISGPNAGTVTRTEVYQPGKTLWDWLNLLGVLAIPAVVGLGAAWYTIQQGKVSDRENTDNQREAALQAYINSMSELLLHEKLRESQPEDEVRTIARVRTLTVLPRLDGRRKASVIQFLYESGLIFRNKWIIDLGGADLRYADMVETPLLIAASLSATDLRGAFLSGVLLSEADLSSSNLRNVDLHNADLHGAFLFGANLSGANLKEANLLVADLRKADLSGADLRGAFLKGVRPNISETNLSEANLSGANLLGATVTAEQLNKAKLLKGAIMPDGTKLA